MGCSGVCYPEYSRARFAGSAGVDLPECLFECRVRRGAGPLERFDVERSRLGNVALYVKAAPVPV